MKNNENYFIHPLSDIQTNHIGDGTRIWQYVVILPGARIGKNCNINAHCFIENEVVLGENVTVKSGNYLWDGLSIEDNVFIGPNVTFTNDKYPRSKIYPEKFAPTIIKRGASIGGGVTVLPGLTIGEGAMVGAGSLVTRDVEPFTLVMGTPARFVRDLHTQNEAPPSTTDKS